MHMTINRETDPLFLILFIAFFIQGCANYKLNYSTEARHWEETIPDKNLLKTHTMYLIGDAGQTYDNNTNPILRYLKTKLDSASTNSSIIFLGDNIYPHGLPPKDEKLAREQAERHLDAQLEILDNFKGLKIFTPGNHDWGVYGIKGLNREERYVEAYLNKAIEDKDDWQNYFLPNDGCSGPEIIEVSEELVIMVVDSNWWLMDWNKDTGINDGCETKSRKDFQFIFEEALRKYRNKHVVIAMHHPMYDNGLHGGYFTVKQHLFPITELYDNFYLPLPGVGSVAAFARGVIGLKQDLANQAYRDLKAALLGAAKKNGNFIFVAGHEHNLQYFENDRQYFVVSGAGSKQNPARLGNGALFAYGQKGYSQLDFYNDGSVWVRFWVPDEKGKSAKLVYQKKIKDKPGISEEDIPHEFPEYEAASGSVETNPIITTVEEETAFYDFVLGEHYSDVYQQKYEFPVLDLRTFKGGLTPVQPGGGNQTNSLRLVADDGKEYTMRALTKDDSRLLPYPFNRLRAAQEIAKVNFLSSHPFAATAVPKLAGAVQVYHTNPELYYVPKQPALEEYNAVFGGEVYLVEERPDADWSKTPSFGNSENIVSTSKVVERLHDKFKYRIDEPWAVRTRLFDLVIGDWDRHDDQWRWAELEQNEDKIYRPIPRDRDQAFSRYDGLVAAIARQTMPFLRQLNVYQPEIKKMKWSTWSARYFDRSFMDEMTWPDWEKEAKYIQTHLTDDVIESAFETWPEKVRQLSANQIISTLKQRRDNVVDMARRHYLLVAKKVDVVGTDGKEQFVVNRLDNNKTQIQVFDLKDGKAVEKVYDRTFLSNETKEIHLYGLSDDDEFVVKGDVNKGILVRLIGGEGNDEFTDSSQVAGWSHKTKVYDSEGEKSKLQLGAEAKNLISNQAEHNIYDRKAYDYEYDYTVPIPTIGYNVDNGFKIGLNLTYTHYAFKKSPYSQIHNIGGSFAFATLSPELTYQGDFNEAIGTWDFLLRSTLRGDRFTRNYFGLGNDSEKTTDDRNFNRVKQSLIAVEPALKRRFAGGSGNFILGATFQRFKTYDTEDRFISDESAGLPDNAFDAKYFAGPKAEFNYINLDNPRITHRGIALKTSVSYQVNLKETSRTNTYYDAELTFYTPIDRNEKLILASRIGTAHLWGDYEFFQLPVLGGKDNLRGFRFDRFYGNSSFYHNIDLRWKSLTSINSVLPLSFGLTGGFDYGRVWLKNEISDTWHYGYGGGFWVAPVDYIALSLGLYHSKENDLLVFKMGFAF